MAKKVTDISGARAPDFAKLAERMYAAFPGNTEEWGKYPRPTGTKGDTGKQISDINEIKTIRSAWGVGEWDSHLRGEFGLGVVPICGDNTCMWGGLDIDVYKGFDPGDLARRITELKLPLTVGRTKSGGAHAWVFLKTPVPAKDLKVKLHEIAAGLGFGKCEVFPKQNKVIVARGEMGSWLNMPYFDLADSPRYAYDDRGKPLSIYAFLDRVEKIKVEWDIFSKITLPTDQEVFKDGPPCLQYITKQGVPEGTRNSVLFNVGVYAHNRWPSRDQSEEFVRKFNSDFCDPPLSSTELSNILSSTGRKDYKYTCQQTPLCSFCNAPVCRTRQFGIKAGPGIISMDALTKLDSDPPIWFLDVEDERIELTTDDLLIQSKFQKRCIEALGVMPPRFKDPDWQVVIQGLLENMTVIPVASEATIKGEFFQLLEQLCTERSLALSRDQLLLGMPWKDEETGRVYFRLRDVLDFMIRRGFKDYRLAHIAARMREIPGWGQAFFNIKGRGVNTWYIPIYKELEAPLDTPPNVTPIRPY